jgi:tetraacyldisaccharide-1-P 4'-kinase
VVVINGAPETGSSDSLETEIRNFHPDAVIFHCTQVIRSLIPFPSWLRNSSHPVSAETPQAAYLVSALGNPGRFLRDVRRRGIEVRGSRSYPDHHRLEQKEWLACTDEARSLAVDAIITTEKDAVKISRPPDFPLLVSIQSTELSDAGKFELVLKSCIEKYA